MLKTKKTDDSLDEELMRSQVADGFCCELLQAPRKEFAMEAQALVAISLEGSVG